MNDSRRGRIFLSAMITSLSLSRHKATATIIYVSYLSKVKLILTVTVTVTVTPADCYPFIRVISQSCVMSICHSQSWCSEFSDFRCFCSSDRRHEDADHGPVLRPKRGSWYDRSKIPTRRHGSPLLFDFARKHLSSISELENAFLFESRTAPLNI